MDLRGMNKKAPFITFEGVDGSGKTTQIDHLEKRVLSDLPYDKVLRVREPGGTPVAESIRHILLDDAHSMSSAVEMHFFNAARADLLEKRVYPALKEGVPVFYDRFYDSTTVYQGHAGGLKVKAVRAINEIVFSSEYIDATFLLDISLKTSYARRLGEKADRIEAKGDTYLENVIRGYQAEEKLHDRIIKIDGEQSVDEVHEDIWNHFVKVHKKYV